jgi:putative ABC transport system ATP-binding protein
MVTHDPFAASFADRVVFLRDGAIVREWKPTDGGDSVQSIIDIMAELES